MSTTNTQDQHVVTAVIVAHDGAAWLPRIAEALLGQTRPVQRVVAVDTGSRDRSGAVLTELLGRSAVFGMDRRTGYGAAIAHALRHRAANTNVPGLAGLAPGDRTEWVWLLHDDCEPAPDALEQLLRGAAQARSLAVLGPKVMDWADRRVLLEAGVTIDGAGRRITGVEPREADQGQHDGDRDVLAVSSAGMLVRRDVWDQVGGFDPAMPLLRDDVDFCWRVHAAGHRVRVITDAIVYHLEATARNRRTPSAAPRPRRMDRHNALLTLLANLPLGPALSALAGNLVLSTLRTVFFLLAKRPRAALDEFTGVTSVVGHPLQLAAARRQRAQGRRAAYSRLRGNLPPGRSVRRLAEFAASVFYTSTQIDTAGSHHATDDPSDDDYMLVDNGFAQRILTHPGVLLVAGLTVVALIAERSLLGAGTLSGGALTPAWGGASGLWHEYLQGFHPAGIGSATSTPPYVAVIATLATVLGGKPWLAIDVIMIGCIPLAGLSAFLAARRVTRSVLACVWAAAAYALLPVGMGAVAAGRFGSAVVFALIPLIAVLAARIFTEGPRRARRAAWAAGLVIGIAAAFVPLIWVVAVLAALLAAVVFHRSGRGMLLNLGITAAVPPILLLPWTLRVAAQPSLLFLEAGNKVPGLATAALPARSLLLLSPGGPGLPPFWVTGGLALAALAALLLTARRFLVMAGWSVALLGLLVSVAVSRMLLTTDDASKRVVGWPGISLAIAAAGLVLAAVVAADALPGQLAGGRWRRPAGLGVLILAAAACSAPLLAAGSWIATGVRGPVGGADAPVLPPFVSVSSDNGLRPRTLVLHAEHGTITYEVLRGSDPLLGATDLTQPPAAQRTLDAVVSTLVAPDGGDAQDQGQALSALNIGYVLLPAPGNGALAGTLSNVAGLRPLSKTAAFQLWRVAQTAARVRVAEPGGRLVTVPSGQVTVSGAAAPRSGGILELAEPAGGWTATLNGTALQSVPSPAGTWAQAFRLPPGGGTLDISHNQLGRTLIVVLEALALLVVVGLALPGARVPAGGAAAAPAGGRRERREKAADALDEPGLEPGSTPAGEDEKPSRGSRLSRRAVAAAGRTGTGTGRDSGPGAGAPPSAAGSGRRGTPGASRRSARHDNEDLSAGAQAELATSAGPEVATGFGADPAGWPGDPPPARPGSSAGGSFWDDSSTMLGGLPAASWDEANETSAVPPGEVPPGAVRPPALAPVGAGSVGEGSVEAEPVGVGPLGAGSLGAEPVGAGPLGAGPASDQDDAPAADRGGRRLWRRGRKAQKAEEQDAPEQEAAAAYPPGEYAGSGSGRASGTGPRRRGDGGGSGPYPSPSYVSGGYPSGEYSGAGRRRGSRRAGRGNDDGGAAHIGTDEGGTDYTSAGRSAAGYPRADYPNADYPSSGHPSADYGWAAHDDGGVYGSGEYPQAGQGGGRLVSRGRLPGDDDALPPPRRGTGSGSYPAGAGFPATGSRHGGAAYPDDVYPDDVYPDDVYPDDIYPDAPDDPGSGRPGTPESPRSAGPGSYPGDSSRSDAGRDGAARSSPGSSGSAWEPARWSDPAAGYPDPEYAAPEYPAAQYPATGYPGTSYPGTSYPGTSYPGTSYPGPEYQIREYSAGGDSAAGYPAAGRSAAGDPDGEYPSGPYPEADDPAPKPYSGTEFPGPDYPAPEDYFSGRTHLAWGPEPADEPGEDDW